MILSFSVCKIRKENLLLNSITNTLNAIENTRNVFDEGERESGEKDAKPSCNLTKFKKIAFCGI